MSKIVPKNGYFSQKNCQGKGQLLDSQNMKKKIWGGTTICKKIIPENAYFSQYEPLNLIGHGNGEGGKKLLDHHNEPKENWGAPQFVKKSYPKMAIFRKKNAKLQGSSLTTRT